MSDFMSLGMSRRVPSFRKASFPCFNLSSTSNVNFGISNGWGRWRGRFADGPGLSSEDGKLAVSNVDSELKSGTGWLCTFKVALSLGSSDIELKLHSSLSNAKAVKTASLLPNRGKVEKEHLRHATGCVELQVWLIGSTQLHEVCPNSLHRQQF